MVKDRHLCIAQKNSGIIGSIFGDCLDYEATSGWGYQVIIKRTETYDAEFGWLEGIPAFHKESESCTQSADFNHEDPLSMLLVNYKGITILISKVFGWYSWHNGLHLGLLTQKERFESIHAWVFLLLSYAMSHVFGIWINPPHTLHRVLISKCSRLLVPSILER